MDDPGGFSSSSSLSFSEINAGGGLLVYIVTTDDSGTTRRNHFPSSFQLPLLGLNWRWFSFLHDNLHVVEAGRYYMPGWLEFQRGGFSERM